MKKKSLGNRPLTPAFPVAFPLIQNDPSTHVEHVFQFWLYASRETKTSVKHVWQLAPPPLPCAETF